jgi:hypothetical protein
MLSNTIHCPFPACAAQREDQNTIVQNPFPACAVEREHQNTIV